MDNNRFTQTIELTLKPSRYLLSFIVGIHLLVAIIALSTPAFPLWIRILMAIVVGISAWRSLKLQYWHSSMRSIHAIRWLESGEWQIQVGTDSPWQTVALAKQSFVKRWVVILGFTHPKLGYVSAIILPDALNADLLQSLIMRWSVGSS
ncbi:protein YgfX [Thiofilum flexile]|uniref:protein YgfX n=1 Tax=Thiofilum flexile TaxID=125627 RepID=UPI000373A312|nr:protein YgfX [Thiofilum flexile]